MTLVEIEGLEAGYGAATVLRGISLGLRQGEIVALLGANGAGKTTLLRTISGLVPARAGSIRLDGTELTGRAPEAIVRLGLAHVPEGRRLFPGLSARENLLAGGAGRRNATRRARDADLARVLDLFPEIVPFLDRPAWSLSGGQQQMVAIGRALMAAPRVLLLDEPSLGLAPPLVEALLPRVVAIAGGAVGDGPTAILLVEQNAAAALAVAARAVVLARSAVVLDRPAEGLVAGEILGALAAAAGT